MRRLLEDLAPLRRVICAPDYDRAVAYVGRLLPSRVVEYDAPEHNGWVVPPVWEPEEAVIRRDGRTVYDGMAHPLGLIALSAPFEGRVDREELRRHLHWHHGDPDAIPFHYRQQFRPWARDWGFCLPQRLYDALEPGSYDVRIRTREAPGRLRALEAVHPGERSETIVLAAHLDRPGVANDGLSGAAVAVEAFRRLPGRRTRFTYRLALVAGTIGSEYYLAFLPPEERARLFEGVFLEMLGSTTPLVLQRSREGRATLDSALARALGGRGAPHRVADFETVLVNDEYVWEGHGVPMASLSRFPYPEYHSSRDNAAAMSEAALEEAAAVLLAAIDDLEATPLVTRGFDGILCLSNPEYDLYVDPGEPVLGRPGNEESLRWRRLMDLIPALRRPATTRDLAERTGLPEPQVRAYLARWREKGLIAMD